LITKSTVSRRRRRSITSAVTFISLAGLINSEKSEAGYGLISPPS